MKKRSCPFPSATLLTDIPLCSVFEMARVNLTFINWLGIDKLRENHDKDW